MQEVLTSLRDEKEKNEVSLLQNKVLLTMAFWYCVCKYHVVAWAAKGFSSNFARY